MKRSIFIFDMNKCVGCMACVAGCSIENETPTALNWRSVNTFNPLHHPDLPLFHFSLACNHCEDAPCMKNCPASAYTRDPERGLIIHHADFCIGCKYCTWACPYDAPKYNPTKGIIEKCTFCIDRLDTGRSPACTDACPVAALTYDQANFDKGDQNIPGFIDAGINPAIQLVPLRELSSTPQIWNMDKSDPDPSEFFTAMEKPSSKIHLSKEWVLVLFTTIIPFLAGWFISSVTHNILLDPYVFAGLAVFCLGISTIHLGRKTKAWRAILHVRRSWLSREILFTLSFLITGFLFLIDPGRLTAYLSMLFALLSMLSIDMVYNLLKRDDGLLIHSALALFTGILFYGLFAQIPFLAGFSLTFKAGLFVYRMSRKNHKAGSWYQIFSLIRISALLLALIYLGFDLTNWLPYPFIIGLVLIGELIDRAMFYDESRIDHPASELYFYLKNKMNEKQEG